MILFLSFFSQQQAARNIMSARKQTPGRLPVCPLCQLQLDMDEAALNHHINSHLDRPAPSPSRSPSPPRTNQPASSASGRPVLLSSVTSRGQNRKSLVEDRYVQDTFIGAEDEKGGADDEECFNCGYPFRGLTARDREVHANNCLGQSTAW